MSKNDGACSDVITLEKRAFHIWCRLPGTPPRFMMLCMSRMLRRGSAFAARLARRDQALSLAGLSCRHYSTETAPHIPGMEYQVCCLTAAVRAPAG